MVTEAKPSLTLGSINVCPLCNSTSIIIDSVAGEAICRSCGAVLTEKAITSEPTWRKSGEDNVRTSFFHTYLGNEESIGNALLNDDLESMSRIPLLCRRGSIHSSANRSLNKGLKELEKIADKLGVSRTIVEQAAWIYRKVLKKGFTRGRPIQATAAAALYAACRELGAFRTLKDFAAITNISEKDLARCYRKMLSIIDLHLPSVDLMKCMSRIAASVGFSEKVKRRAFELLRIAQKSGNLVGKDPMGTAAAVLYIAGTLEGEQVKQKDLAKAASVTEVTIRNRCRSLKNFTKRNGKFISGRKVVSNTKVDNT